MLTDFGLSKEFLEEEVSGGAVHLVVVEAFQTLTLTLTLTLTTVDRAEP